MGILETATNVLIAARQKISDPAHWTQGSFARDANGNLISTNDKEATCFCSYGVIWWASGGDERSVYVANTFLQKAICDESIITYNDSHTHEEVIAMFDKAIELSQQ